MFEGRSRVTNSKLLLGLTWTFGKVRLDYGTPEGRGSILIASDGDTKNAWAATPSNTYI